MLERGGDGEGRLRCFHIAWTFGSRTGARGVNDGGVDETHQHHRMAVVRYTQRHDTDSVWGGGPSTQATTAIGVCQE